MTQPTANTFTCENIEGKWDDVRSGCANIFQQTFSTLYKRGDWMMPKIQTVASEENRNGNIYIV